MKNRTSVFPMALAAIAAAAVCLGVPWSAARAQNSSTASYSIAAAPAAGARQVPALPYGAGEVMKMYQGGINKDVIVSYINNSSLPFHLSADGIVYLQSLGVPQEITQAMIERDGQMQQQQYQQQQQAMQPQPMGAAPAEANSAVVDQPPAQVVMPTTPAPSVTVIGGSDYPNYDYGYPDYYDNGGFYYGAPLVIGGGWGWGYGGYGGYGGYRGGVGGFRGGGGIGGFHGGGGVGGFHGGGGVGGFHGGGGVGGFHGGGGVGGFHGGGGGGGVGGGHGGGGGGGGGHR